MASTSCGTGRPRRSAVIITQAVGLDTNTAAVDYIQFYRGDKAALVESLNFIQSAAAEILALLSPDA